MLVGEIGIMNIMLVSVTERTREIGIRMAVGARARDILWQFMLEALMLSCIGGLLGILLGLGGATAVARFSQLPVEVTPASVLIAFLFAGLVGVFFGLHPARKASRLRPIDALRYE
jgi:putative ABC transport system permease protein